ncbi:psbQ-like protein 3, chloroplastic [Diospyros lotus]|uniref:psbQ-like protein 3, chloroplastic n=1 Tax=Diospyros lotus TaxID=55363 RepID=UPI00224DFF21|nr:psbQ-like protein 3, chloroplastic [Diospyros lotus]
MALVKAIISAFEPNNLQKPFPDLTNYQFKHRHDNIVQAEATHKQSSSSISRRLATASSLLLLSNSRVFATPVASALDLRMMAPDQSVAEAEAGIRGHAQDLLRVKAGLLEPEAWKEAQKALRKSAAYLKQDIYTIIQSKPGKERPQLRKLYSVLFNAITALDYAARDRDIKRVQKFYDALVLALDDILSKI